MAEGRGGQPPGGGAFKWCIPAPISSQTRATISARGTRVYNFHVAELQNYAVGGCGVLVHNTNEPGLGKDVERAVSRFSKLKLGQQVDEYKSLLKTYRKHLDKYGQQPGQTSGEVNRIERQLHEYRRILEGRGKQFGPCGELVE